MLRRVPPFEACGGATGFGPWGSTTTLLIVILPTVFFNSGGHLPRTLLVRLSLLPGEKA